MFVRDGPVALWYGDQAQEQDRLAGRLAEIRPHLNERQWRLLLGAEARAIGRGGVKLVAKSAGASADTVSRGARELEAGIEPDGRVRRTGAGRPAVEEADPGLVPALEALVDPETRGDPESPLRWTAKSTSRLADELAAQGHAVTGRTVARLLEAGRLQPAGQRQDRRGEAAPGPRRPVPVHQRAGHGVPGGRRPGHLGRHEKEGAGRQLRQRRRGVGARRVTRAR